MPWYLSGYGGNSNLRWARITHGYFLKCCTEVEHWPGSYQNLIPCLVFRNREITTPKETFGPTL